jgi:hypothetical protein
VTQPSTIGRGSWRLRQVPQHLRDRYLAEGWWTDATLGQMVADGLGSMRHVGFRARSTVRPWDGTFADVDRAPALSPASCVPAGSARAAW